MVLQLNDDQSSRTSGNELVLLLRSLMAIDRLTKPALGYRWAAILARGAKLSSDQEHRYKVVFIAPKIGRLSLSQTDIPNPDALIVDNGGRMNKGGLRVCASIVVSLHLLCE